MSKYRRPILLVLGAAFVLLQGFSGLAAQDMGVGITINEDEPSIALVDVKFANGKGPRDIRFLDRFGSVTGLDTRIADVRVTDDIGRSGGKLANGDRLAAPAAALTYRADISPLDNRFAAAHVSRSDRQGAVIVLDDILPQLGPGPRSARVTFKLPAGWTVSTSERLVGNTAFEVADVENSVFVAGRAIRQKIIRAGRAELSISIDGDWHFTDEDAAEMAGSVFATYENIFRGVPAEKVHIAIMPFPHNVPVGEWEGGSRGTSITIVSSDMPFKNQSLQRLHEQLRHEIFHLWVPNGIKLNGNYDWFYEGFALYASLKTGVAANRIRFEDMLDTLGRAYDIGGRQSGESLTDLSRNRWNGSNTRVYARGMLIAFLSDIAMMEASKGKRSINNVLGTVFQRHRSSGAEDANAAILAILRSHDQLTQLVDRYIVSGAAVEWKEHLRAAGLESSGDRGPTRLKAVIKPSRSQKQMLDDLGYNNWRKLSSNNK